MILSATLDPSLFETDSLLPQGTRTQERLDEMRRAYVWIAGAATRKCIFSRLDDIVGNGSLDEPLRLRAQKVRKRIEVLAVNRLVEAQNIRFDDAKWGTVTYDTACVGALMREIPEIDVMFTTSRNCTSLRTLTPQLTSRVHDYETFVDSAAYETERDSRAARPLNGLTVSAFEELMRPVCRWESQLHVIDRYISTSALKDQKNWRSFFETIKILYKSWESGPSCIKKKQFRIRTFVGKPDVKGLHAPKETPEQRRMRAKTMGETLQARLRSIGDRLHVDVCDLRQNPSMEHDRYLVAFKGDLVVGFSSGFDDVKGQQMGPCDVYLRGSSARDADDVVKVMLSAPVLWRSEDAAITTGMMGSALANIGL